MRGIAQSPKPPVNCTAGRLSLTLMWANSQGTPIRIRNSHWRLVGNVIYGRLNLQLVCANATADTSLEQDNGAWCMCMFACVNTHSCWLKVISIVFVHVCPCVHVCMCVSMCVCVCISVLWVWCLGLGLGLGCFCVWIFSASLLLN